MKTNVGVFYGCRSVEHEVSIISAVQAMRSINRDKYSITPVYVAKNGKMYTGEKLFQIENYRNLDSLLKSCDEITFLRNENGVFMHLVVQKAFKKKDDIRIDVAFPVVHGTNCEDGTIAGYFEFLNIPYVSCDVASAAIGMDKAVFKDVLKAAGLPVLDCVRLKAREYALDKEGITEKIVNEIGFPLIVKPINLGSSVGISKVKSLNELDSAISLAFSFTDRILCEKAIENLREINCSVLGDADDCIASVCEEPFMHDEILSYKDKYQGGGKSEGPSKGMASLGRKIPADIPEEKANEIKELSCKIVKVMNASGVVRIDYLYDTVSDRLYANEINTVPGSLAFYLWEASGVKYPELIDRLIELAFKRQRTRDNLSFAIDTNILSSASFGSKGAKGVKM